jgi:predicted Zn finger-like uncharacterized protein
MIINCPCGEKKFQIDDKLIPINGRLLQCGSCDKSWFFKPQENKEIIKTEVVDIPQNINKQIEENNIKKKKIDKNKNHNNNITRNYELTKYKKKTKFSFTKLLSYLVVFIISFIALIIIIDTFKKPLYSSFPVLEMIIFNLFETLVDIKLFVKDLL